MDITIFSKEYRQADSIANFMDFYNALRLKYLASDLLAQGLSPKQISEAVVKAVNVGKASGLNMHQHFWPIFSGIEKEIISDCKLSHLAYCLVLMNADVKLRVVGDFQVSVIQQYLEAH